MEDADKKITTTVPPFSGNAEDFPQYEMLLQSTLELFGIGYVLTTNPGDQLPDDDAVLDPANEEDKKKLKWRRDNARAMQIMITGQKEPEVLHGFAATKTAKRKTGSAYDCMTWMKKEYSNGDDLDETFFEEELSQISLGPNENPRVITKQIAKVTMKYSFTLTEARRVAIIKRCGMRYYSSVLTSGTTMIKLAKGRNPYAFELMDIMVSDFKMRKGLAAITGDDDDGPAETGLTAIDRNRDRNLGTRNHGRGNGNRGGGCWKCGSNDHIRADCPRLNCKYPGCHSRKGHSTENCFWNPKNASKRPDWFKRLMQNMGRTDEQVECDTVEVLI